MFFLQPHFFIHQTKFGQKEEIFVLECSPKSNRNLFIMSFSWPFLVSMLCSHTYHSELLLNIVKVKFCQKLWVVLKSCRINQSQWNKSAWFVSIYMHLLLRRLHLTYWMKTDVCVDGTPWDKPLTSPSLQPLRPCVIEQSQEHVANDG